MWRLCFRARYKPLESEASAGRSNGLVNPFLEIAAAKLAASEHVVEPDVMAQVVADVLAGPELLGCFLAKPIATEEDRKKFVEALMPYVVAWYEGRR